MSLRSRLKRTLEVAVVASGAADVLRRRRAGDILVLAYHNVVPDGGRVAGEAALHVTADRFRRHMDVVADSCDVVSLAEVYEPAPEAVRPRVAITFDDAYRGAVNTGLVELASRGFSATVFVAPSFVETQQPFWWDVAAGAKGWVDPELRRRALHDLQGRDSTVRAALGLATVVSLPDHARASSEAELEEAARMPGVTLGSHSWSHPNLARLEPDALREELTRPRRWLEERFDAVIPWLAYPYGLSDPDVEAAAERAGYDGAVRIEGGWTVGSSMPSPYAVPRLNVPAGLTGDGLALRLAGLLCR